MPSYNDILSEDDINELLTLRDSATECQFRVGDLTLKYIDKKEIYGVTKQYVYSAVGSFFGKQARTIRGYSVVSAFYPIKVRQQYPTLSVDHFKVAMRTDNWQEVLEFALSNLDSRPESVDSCIARFGIETKEQGSIEDALSPIRKYIARLPGVIRERIEHLLDAIEEAIKEVA